MITSIQKPPVLEKDQEILNVYLCPNCGDEWNTESEASEKIIGMDCLSCGEENILPALSIPQD